MTEWLENHGIYLNVDTMSTIRKYIDFGDGDDHYDHPLFKIEFTTPYKEIFQFYFESEKERDDYFEKNILPIIKQRKK